MKKQKKIIIVPIIVVLISVIMVLVYLIFKPKIYSLHVKTGETYYDYAEGILVKSFWKSAFYLNVNFDNPNAHCSVGIYIKSGDDFKVLEAYEGNTNDECNAIVTESGFSVTNKEFYRIETNYSNGNIVSKMLENKEQIYLCVSDKNINSVTSEDCYPVDIDLK